MDAVSVIPQSGPIILTQPHSGTYVPEDIRINLNDLGRDLIDTDWHVPELYDGLLTNATIVRANFSRYVIDANRDPTGLSLYPGQNTTELVPTTTFDGHEIWKTLPDQASINNCLEKFHAAYHKALEQEIDRVKARHGVALVYDCHSIRSLVPHLFDGQLPDLNLGTKSGDACSSRIKRCVEDVCQHQANYSWVTDQRFKGGWTTRHYGKPQQGVHAVQMEIAQHTYLKTQAKPFAYDIEKASKLRCLLADVLVALDNEIESSFLVKNNFGGEQ